MMKVRERVLISDHLKQGVRRGGNIVSMGGIETEMGGGGTGKRGKARGTGPGGRVKAEGIERLGGGTGTESESNVVMREVEEVEEGTM